MLYATFVAIRSHMNRKNNTEQSFKYTINKKKLPHIYSNKIKCTKIRLRMQWAASCFREGLPNTPRTLGGFKPFRAKTSNRVLFFVRQKISCCLIISWPLCQVHRYSGRGTTKFHHTQAFKMPGNERFICQQRGLWLKCLRTAIRETER